MMVSIIVNINELLYKERNVKDLEKEKSNSKLIDKLHFRVLITYYSTMFQSNAHGI